MKYNFFPSFNDFCKNISVARVKDISHSLPPWHIQSNLVAILTGILILAIQNLYFIK